MTDETVSGGDSHTEAAAPGGMGNESENEEEKRAAEIKKAAPSGTGDENALKMQKSADETKAVAPAAEKRKWGQGNAKGDDDEEPSAGEDDKAPKPDDDGEESEDDEVVVVAVKSGNDVEEEVDAVELVGVKNGDDVEEEVAAVASPDEKARLRAQIQQSSVKKNLNRARKDAKLRESVLYMQDSFEEDYPDRIKGLGLTKTYAVRRKMVALHQVDAVGEPLYDDFVPCGSTWTEINAWYRHMFDHAGVLVRDVHAFLPETLSKDAPTEVYNLQTIYVVHQGKGWYFTPSLLYKPSYIDCNAPLFNSWLSNGDVVLYTPTGKVHEDGSLDEAANALTFIGAFLHWDSRDQRAQPDVRAVFCRSISLLKTAKMIHLDQKTNASNELEVNWRKYFIEQDIDVMNWQPKKEAELTWQVAL